MLSFNILEILIKYLVFFFRVMKYLVVFNKIFSRKYLVIKLATRLWRSLCILYLFTGFGNNDSYIKEIF